jgi:hypothetical protein
MTWKYDEVTVERDLTGEDGMPLKEELELWRRDPVECIRELIGNPAFRDVMRYTPECIYADEEGHDRIIDEMWTGDWWWSFQVRIAPPKSLCSRPGYSIVLSG